MGVKRRSEVDGGEAKWGEISTQTVTSSFGKFIPLDQWTVPKLWSDLKVCSQVLKVSWKKKWTNKN